MQTCKVNESGQAECGEPAALLVNGFPMCGDHIGQYAQEELIESADLLPCDQHELTGSSREKPCYCGSTSAGLHDVACPVR